MVKRNRFMKYEEKKLKFLNLTPFMRLKYVECFITAQEVFVIFKSNIYIHIFNLNSLLYLCIILLYYKYTLTRNYNIIYKHVHP